MHKVKNTYYSFENTMPDATQTSGTAKGAKTEKPIEAANIKPVTFNQSRPMNEFDQAVQTVTSGGNWKNIFSINKAGVKYALIGAGAGLLYAISSKKHWFVLTAAGGILGMGAYNIYKIVKPINKNNDGK